MRLIVVVSFFFLQIQQWKDGPFHEVGAQKAVGKSLTFAAATSPHGASFRIVPE